MRFYEIVSLVVLIPFVIWPLLPWRRTPRPNILPLAALVFLVLHFVSEGYRWQMIPAYILIVGLAVLAVMNLVQGGVRLGKGPIIFSIFMTLWLLIAFALPSVMPVPKLLEPTGIYGIGTFSEHLIDSSREEIYTAEAGDFREIMVQVWYPARIGQAAERSLYNDSLAVAGPAIADQFGLPPFLLDHVNLAHSYAYKDVPLANSERPFPIIIFSHGLGGIRSQNMAMVNELVSNGYVVAAIDHTFGNAVTAFPDGRVILYDGYRLFEDGESNPVEGNVLVKQWTQDIDFVLDEMTVWQAEGGHLLNGRLDLTQVGIFGHSTGGGATVEYCMGNGRCQAGVVLDGWLLPVSGTLFDSPPQQPFMFISTPRWIGEENRAHGQKLFAQLPNAAYRLILANTSHYDFSDFPLLSPLTPQMGVSGTIDSRYSLMIQNEYLLAFFDRYLKEGSETILKQPSPYPELQIETR